MHMSSACVVLPRMWAQLDCSLTGSVMLVLVPGDDLGCWRNQVPETHHPCGFVAAFEKCPSLCTEGYKGPTVSQVLASGGITHVYRFKLGTWKGSSTHPSAIWVPVSGWGTNKARRCAEAFWCSLTLGSTFSTCHCNYISDSDRSFSD